MNKPISLNPISNHKIDSAPNSDDIIKAFIEDYTLDESHQLLWQLLSISFSGNLQSLSRRERDNLANYYKRLEFLLSAIYDRGKLSSQT